MSVDTRGKTVRFMWLQNRASRAFSESLGKEINEFGIKVTLIEPGLVGTDINPLPPDEQREKQAVHEMLKTEDIAMAVLYALSQPPRCDVVGLKISRISWSMFSCPVFLKFSSFNPLLILVGNSLFIFFKFL